jgi:hypothetical protein
MSLNIVSRKDALDIIKIDSKALSSDPNRFVSENGYLGYLAINTWLNCINQYAPLSVPYFVKRMKEEGLSSVIRRCDLSATELLSSAEWDDMDTLVNPSTMSDYLAVAVYGELLDSRYNYRKDPTKYIGLDSTATFVFLMRFLKRLTYNCADKLELVSMDNFNRVNTEVRKRYRTEPDHWYIVKLLREEIASLPWNKIRKDLEIAKHDPYEWQLTSGSCTDGKTVIDKLEAMYREDPGCLHPIMGFYPYELDGTTVLGSKLPVTIMAVPKSYKAYRIIAPDSVMRNAKGKVLASIIERILPVEIPLRNQGQNMEISRVASVSREFGTFDQSNASDRIPKHLFRDIFPLWFVNLVDDLLPDRLTNGTNCTKAVEMMSTAGNSLTFILESIVFWAIARLSIDYTNVWGSTRPRKIHKVCSVYGDDVIIPTRCSDLFMELCDYLGFELNRDKSHWAENDPYRESCGAEWYNGTDVSSYYWPRANLRLSSRAAITASKDVWRNREEETTPYQSLVSLQHRLYYVAPFAAAFLSEEILQSDDKITSSHEGGSVDEVWTYEELVHKYPSPYSEIRANQYGQRELHRLPSQPSSYDPRKCTVTIRPRRISRKHLNGRQLIVASHYVYMQYLKEGPFYATPMDELLGLSQSRWSLMTNGNEAKVIHSPK